MADVNRQLRALLRKNYILKKRSRKSTGGEIIFSLYSVAALFLLSLILPPVRVAQQEERAPKIEAVAKDSLCSQSRAGKDSIVGFTPGDHTDVQKLMEMVQSSTGCGTQGFATDSEMETFFGNHAGVLRAGVVFSVSSGERLVAPDRSVSYSLRFNTTLISIDTHENSKFIESGFLALQAAVDEAILQVSCEQSEPPCTAPVLMTSVQEFPRLSAVSVENTLAYIWPFIFIQTLFFNLQTLLIQLGTEKESRLKEAMKMMGLRNEAFWLSWFLTQAVMVTMSVALMVLGLYVSGLVRHSSIGAVFFLFWSYGVSLTTFAFFLSTFFDQSKQMFAFSSTLLFVSMGGYYAIEALALAIPTVHSAFKMLPLLFSPVALGHGVFNMALAEGQGKGMLLWGAFEGENGAGLCTLALAMLLDTVLYAILAWYFDRVLPSAHGAGDSWLFFLKRKNSTPGSTAGGEGYTALAGDGANESGHSARFSAVAALTNAAASTTAPDVLRAVDVEQCGVCIKSLRKTFPRSGRSKAEKIAVDNLSLAVGKYGIFALLGHNGAGKTTTISMLTGLFPPSGGDAFIAGCSIVDNMEGVRERLGVCPQYDVLWDELTAMETLRLYAAIKGIAEQAVEHEAATKLEDVGLTDKANELVKSFSGGMKRRLSVAVALMGDPQVVFLDEPSTGMDPFSRSKVWDLLQKNKASKCIILTTHAMEEADCLGDCIGIMSRGNIKAIGTALELKNRYGIGYRLTCSIDAECEVDAVGAVVDQHVQGKELLTAIGAELTFALPLDEARNFPDLINELETRKQELHLSGFGISMTTLEEVFLKLAEEEDEDCDT